MSIPTATYVRVSTDSQAEPDKTSLGEQQAAINAYCQDHDLDIIAKHTDIASGASRKRPGFVALQSDIRAGRVQKVVAWNADRLARSGSAMGDLLDTHNPADRVIETVQTRFDYKYSGLMAEIARIERESILERTASGRVGAAKLGRVPAGKPPYGYTRNETGRPVVVAHEAQAVAALFTLYANERMGMPSIMPVLAREHGLRYSSVMLYKMLRNPAYVGRLDYKGVTIPTPPIIDDSTFQRAQRILDSQRTRGTQGKGSTKYVYTLQKLLTCEGCDRLLGVRSRGEKGGESTRYYRCYGYTPACRPHPYIRADDIEPRVWDEIAGLLKHPRTLINRFTDGLHDGALAADITGAVKDVARWTRKAERLLALYLDEVIDRQAYERQAGYINEPLEAAQDRLERLHREREAQAAQGDIAEAFIAFCEQREGTLDGLDAEGRQAVLRAVIEQATIGYDNQVHYRLRIPMPTKGTFEDMAYRFEGISASELAKHGLDMVASPLTDSRAC